MDDCKIAYCTTCGRQLKPLFNTTMFCPNDCDRIPQHVDKEITEKLGPNRCPKCNSLDIAPFAMMFHTATHCIDCGHVW